MNNSIKKMCLLTGAAISLQHSIAIAAEQNPIIVTATRTAQKADESLASVTVISRDDLEQSQARTLVEVLQKEAGFHISRNGGPGKSTNFFLRGTESDHVLVLIDGVRAASATLGSFAWAQLSPEQIERIEIVRGPKASLYGSDAIGGVIHIFTRKNKAPHIRVAYGSHNTRELSVGLGGGEQWQYSLEVGKQQTDGIPITATATEDRGFKNTHFAFAVDGSLNKDNHLSLSINQSIGRNSFDSGTGDSEHKNRIISTSLVNQTSDTWLQTFKLGHTVDRSVSHSPFTPSTITTNRDSASWQNDVSINDSLLSVGIDYWVDNAIKNGSGNIDATVYNSAGFLEYQFSTLGSDWIVGGRRDKHSDFGYHNTWNINWGKDIGDKLRLTASHGTAFKSPSVNDLYWPFNSSPCWYNFSLTCITQGNTALAPETSRTSELGISKRFTNSKISANAFYTETRNMIDWATTQTGPTQYTTTPTNVKSAEIKGMELQADLSLGDWDTAVRVTLLDAIDVSRQQQLDRRPKQTVNLLLNRSYGKHNSGIEVLYNGAHLDAGGTIKRGGYTLTNLVYGYEYSKALKIQARAENIFDKDYVITSSSFAGDYATLGRTAYLTLNYYP